MIFPLGILQYQDTCYILQITFTHDDGIKWKPFLRYWTFVRGIHRPPLNFPRKRQWRGVLMFPWSVPWISGWVTIVRLVIWDAIALIFDVIVMVTAAKLHLSDIWSVREITKSSSTFSATNISSNRVWLLQLHDTIQTKSQFGTKFSSIYLAKWEKSLDFLPSFVNLQRAKDGTHMFDAKYRYVFVV